MRNEFSYFSYTQVFTKAGVSFCDMPAFVLDWPMWPNPFCSFFILEIYAQKTPSPKLTFENSALLRLQGFEPWTNRLRVYCSTS